MDDTPWRVGRQVPKNVYVGNEIAGQFQRQEWAMRAVTSVNAQIANERITGETAREQIRAVISAMRVGWRREELVEALLPILVRMAREQIEVKS